MEGSRAIGNGGGWLSTHRKPVAYVVLGITALMGSLVFGLSGAYAARFAPHVKGLQRWQKALVIGGSGLVGAVAFPLLTAGADWKWGWSEPSRNRSRQAEPSVEPSGSDSRVSTPSSAYKIEHYAGGATVRYKSSNMFGPFGAAVILDKRFGVQYKTEGGPEEYALRLTYPEDLSSREPVTMARPAFEARVNEVLALLGFEVQDQEGDWLVAYQPSE